MNEIDVTKLALEPGDILVVQCAADLDLENVHRAFGEAFKLSDIRGVTVMVGRKGDVELSVVKASIPPERRCYTCGTPTNSEEALVDGQHLCHPCADL